MSIWIKSAAVVLLFALGACSAEQAAPSEPVSSPFARMPDTVPIKPGSSPEPAGERVIAYRYIPFGELREFVTLEQREDAAAFREAIKRAKPASSGQRRSEVPADYGIRLVVDGEEKTYLLWLGSSGGGPGIVQDLQDRDARYVLGSEDRQDLYDRIDATRYDSERAEKNGDIVQTYGRVIHMETWTDFIQNVDSGRSDSVQFTGYTIEGDPIFDNLSYDGSHIYYAHDNSHDSFGLPAKPSYTCEKIITQPLDVKRGGPGILYRLDGCTGASKDASKETSEETSAQQFWFPVPESTVTGNPAPVKASGNPGLGQTASDVYGGLEADEGQQMFRRPRS